MVHLLRLAIQLALAAVCFASPAEEQKSYHGHEIWTVPMHGKKFDHVSDFFVAHNIVVLSEPRAPHYAAHILVSPQDWLKVSAFLKSQSINFKRSVTNVQELIDGELDEDRRRATSGNTRAAVVPGKYGRYADIKEYVDALPAAYPDLVSVETIGSTAEGRVLQLIKIRKTLATKPIIFLDAGIHARERIAPAAMIIFLDQFLTKLRNNDPIISSLANKYDWFIVPLINADGYEYTWTNDRMWRKNRKPGTGSCAGVDINRNFDYKFGGAGTSGSQCSDLYRGPSANSELETKALTSTIQTHATHIKAYLSLHSYGQYILCPWGFDTSRPSDAAEIDRVGRAGATAIARRAGTRYTVGGSGIIVGATAGSSDDWAKGVANVKYTYTVELSPDDNSGVGFLLPEAQALNVGLEVFDGIIAMAQEYV